MCVLYVSVCGVCACCVCCVCVSLSTGLSSQSISLVGRIQFLKGLVFVFLPGGEVVFCFCEIRKSESGLSPSVIFPKHLVLVELSCN